MRAGVLDGRAVLIRGELAADVAVRGLPGEPMALLERWPELRELAAGLPDDAFDLPLGQAAWQAPVPRPRQVFAVALNYPPHAAEAGFDPPEHPLVFTKFPACLTGPRSIVTLPEGKVDWEAELVAVIGRHAHRVSEERAWEHVAALTAGQDLSERVTQSRGAPAQFSLGKSFPGFGPTGPLLVTPDELADPDDLEITCLLNGEVVQHDRTKSMIFPVPELVARISAVVPLLPGDLIFTGTPAGVGNRRTPPRYLSAGDELVTRIEGIGELRQTFQ
ncbi:fumarylacetoacetate hydrolase family protein [Nonomuraea zeae]|uniref:Fumarylacetoacetate hydrolase family protein n=1 Tax=Nonomuraea zeae TaxID=1642303 RepID=A0A5S4GZ42_9ACTN|nr:fumarylacetoacetate hydrolase family protein [Nonomuraea zeae]TMR38235.1 fumarylacetoacetate hydrolase family protein [Nonomuraea zeae]